MNTQRAYHKINIRPTMNTQRANQKINSRPTIYVQRADQKIYIRLNIGTQESSAGKIKMFCTFGNIFDKRNI